MSGTCYIFNASLYCQACGEQEATERALQLDPADRTDYSALCGETDSPSHCANEEACRDALDLGQYRLDVGAELFGAERRLVGAIIPETLTAEGCTYVRSLVRSDGTPYQRALWRAWREAFPEAFSTIDLVRLLDESDGPGRFEGEPPETLHYWERSMAGEGESLASSDDGSGADVLDVDADEREAFGFGADVVGFLLEWNSAGFVTGTPLTAAEADRVRARAEEERGPAPEDYIISDARGGRYSVGQCEGRHVGEYRSRDAAEDAIREHAGGSFFPDVWVVSDHGNAVRLAFDWTRVDVGALRELHSVTVDTGPEGTWNVWRAGELAGQHATKEEAQRDANELARELGAKEGA